MRIGCPLCVRAFDVPEEDADSALDDVAVHLRGPAHLVEYEAVGGLLAKVKVVEP